MKPFFIYTTNGNLFIKNINEDEIQISSNIYIYTVSIDKYDNINIFCITTLGKIIHIFKKDNSWQSNIIGRFSDRVRSIKDFICIKTNDNFNLFITEKNVFSNKYYKNHHLNYSNKTLKTFVFKDVIAHNKKIFNIETINLNIHFEYKIKNGSQNLVFDYSFSNWIYKDKSYQNNNIL